MKNIETEQIKVLEDVDLYLEAFSEDFAVYTNVTKKITFKDFVKGEKIESHLIGTDVDGTEVIRLFLSNNKTIEFLVKGSSVTTNLLISEVTDPLEKLEMARENLDKVIELQKQIDVFEEDNL